MSSKFSIQKLNDDERSAVTDAHLYLINFLDESGLSERVGIHDFIEWLIADMVSNSIGGINAVFNSGRDEINGSHLCNIVCEEFQKTLDETRRDMGRFENKA